MIKSKKKKKYFSYINFSNFRHLIDFLFLAMCWLQ